MAAAYFAPLDLDDALDVMRAETPLIVAGGTDFFPSHGREAITQPILDLSRVAGLRGIAWSGDWLRIGATSTWTDVIRADLPPAFDALKAAAREVGSIQIQNAGTVAGNLCNASPAADGVPPLLTLEAEVEVASSAGTRRMGLDAFLQGPRQTALGPGEILSALHIPRPPEHTTSAFEKLGARKYLVISIAMTSVIIGLDNGGKIDVARIAVGSCAPVAKRLKALEAELFGQDPKTVTVTPAHLADLAPISDVRADGTYRLEAVPLQITRAIKAAANG